MYISKKDKKGIVKFNGFVNVEKDGGNLKIKFRFFKFNKGGNFIVLIKVYEVIIF